MVLVKETRVLNLDQQAAGSMGLAGAFESSKPTPSDIPPPTRTHFLIVPLLGDQPFKSVSLW